MAAIVPNVEPTVDPEEGEVAEREGHASTGLSGFGDVGAFGIMQETPPLQSSHAELTRTVWIRRTLEDALTQQKYWLERRGGASAEEEAAGEADAEVEQVAGYGANPPGVKVRKGPEHDDDGEWIVSYAGRTVSMHFSPELPRGWNLILPDGVKRPREGFGVDLLTMGSKAEALAKIVKLIDAHDPWIQPYLKGAGQVAGYGEAKARFKPFFQSRSTFFCSRDHAYKLIKQKNEEISAELRTNPTSSPTIRWLHDKIEWKGGPGHAGEIPILTERRPEESPPEENGICVCEYCGATLNVPPGTTSEKAKALAKLKRLLDRAEAHPEEEIDGVAIQSYFDNEVALFWEEYGEAPDLRGFAGLDADAEYTGQVNHEIQIVEGDRVPRDGDASETLDVAGFGKPSGSDKREKGGEWIFRLAPGIPADTIPWYMGAIPNVDTCSFFGSNGKMKCPTWDLPAGAPVTGGTCPGAIGAQSVVPPEERRKALREEGGRFYLPVLQPGATQRTEVDEGRAICQMCYALEGNYPSPHVQIGEMVRYWWTRDMLASGRTEEWITTMVSAVLALRIEESNGIEPIRVHSSGDFFSQPYARAWMEVANRVAVKRPKIRFWAPTRTWAVGWNWERILALNTAGNFIVRPSSYSVGDVAPGELAPGRGAGSTSLLNPDNMGMTTEREAIIVPGRRKQYEHNRQVTGRQGPDRRYDWDCQTYAVALSGKGDLSKSCADATGPEGHQGCRACWTHPNLRINYTTH